MKCVLIALLLGVVADRVEAQNESKMDHPVVGEFRVLSPRLLSPCSLGAIFHQLAQRTNVMVGFETTPDCWLSPRSVEPQNTGEDLTGMTPRQALNYLMTLLRDYRWKEIDDTVVIRPTAAWDDRGDP